MNAAVVPEPAESVPVEVMLTVPVKPVTRVAVRVPRGDADVEARTGGLRTDAPAACLLDEEERERSRVAGERVARPGLRAAARAGRGDREDPGVRDRDRVGNEHAVRERRGRPRPGGECAGRTDVDGVAGTGVARDGVAVRVAGGDPDVEARAGGLGADTPAARGFDEEVAQGAGVNGERVTRPGLRAAAGAGGGDRRSCRCSRS